MKQDEVLDKIADSRQALMSAIDGLDHKTIANAKVDDKWFLKDLLIHVIAWDEVCLEPLRSFAHRGAFNADPIKDHDSWKEQQSKKRAAHPTETILRELTRVRLELLSLVQRLDDTQWKMDLGLPWGERGTIAALLSWLASHETEHIKTIERWRARGG